MPRNKVGACVSNLLYVIFPQHLRIHHIDLNRKNNDISNLIALPHPLHIKLHKAIKKDHWLKERKFLIKFLRDNRICKPFLSEISSKKWLIQCKSCGKSISYDLKTNEWVCRYCGKITKGEEPTNEEIKKAKEIVK